MCLPLRMMPLVDPASSLCAVDRKDLTVTYANRGIISSVQLSLPPAIRKDDGLMWFCPTCRSALHGALKKLEILSAENAALREEVREVRQAVEPTSCAENCEEEQISPRPAGCNTGVNSSRSCPTVCAESVMHYIPYLPNEKKERRKQDIAGRATFTDTRTWLKETPISDLMYPMTSLKSDFCEM